MRRKNEIHNKERGLYNNLQRCCKEEKGEKMKCKWCGKDDLKSMLQHENRCKAKKEFMEQLEKEEFMERNGDFWCSGGAQIVLTLCGGQISRQDLKNWKRPADKDMLESIRKMLKFERNYGIKVHYDSEKDKIKIETR